MPVNELRIQGKVAWRMDHHLPALWLWLFDWNAITESRRLHATAFDAAEHFQGRAARVAADPELAALVAPFAEELRPDRFPRELGIPPDGIISLDLAPLEAQRPFRLEAAAERWEACFAAAEHAKPARALRQFEQASGGPLHFTGARPNDARMLSARALELGLEREERARALLWMLFGQPVTPAARALTFAWTERAQTHPAVGYEVPATWWRRLLGRLGD